MFKTILRAQRFIRNNDCRLVLLCFCSLVGFFVCLWMFQFHSVRLTSNSFLLDCFSLELFFLAVAYKFMEQHAVCSFRSSMEPLCMEFIYVAFMLFAFFVFPLTAVVCSGQPCSSSVDLLVCGAFQRVRLHPGADLLRAEFLHVCDESVTMRSSSFRLIQSQ